MTIEYPPLALAVLLAPLPFVAKDSEGTRGKGADDVAAWTRGFRILYVLVHGTILAGVAWCLRRRKLASMWGLLVGLAGGLVMAYVIYDRLDLLLGLVLLGAMSALVAGRCYLALALLAVAVNLKIVPVLLLPLFFLGTLPESVFPAGLATRRTLWAMLRASAVFAAAILAVFLPFRLAWGPRVLDFLAYHSRRGCQVESMWSSILLVAARLGQPVQLASRFGADELTGHGAEVLAKLSPFVVLAVMVLVYGVVWRRLRQNPPEGCVASAPELTLAERNPQLFVWGAFAVLALAIAGSKVFSPQYLCWFLPCLLLVERPRNIRAVVPLLAFLLACGLATLVYPGLIQELARPILLEGRLTPTPTLLVTLAMAAKNLVWIVFGVLAVAQLVSARPIVDAALVRIAPRGRRRRRQRRR